MTRVPYKAKNFCSKSSPGVTLLFLPEKFLNYQIELILIFETCCRQQATQVCNIMSGAILKFENIPFI